MPRRPCNFTLSPPFIARLRQRADQHDDGNKSRAVERAIEEADGNMRKLRHGSRGLLQAINLSCLNAKAATRQPLAVEAISLIEQTVVELEKLLI